MTRIGVYNAQEANSGTAGQVLSNINKRDLFCSW